MSRTIEYASKGIFVLWLLQWTPKLDAKRYTPQLWEKWLHTAYFGRVYYWMEGLKVASYQFEADFKTIPKKSWYSERGKKITAGGYSRKTKRYRRAIRENILNLANDFVPKKREWWEGNGMVVPNATLFVHRQQRQKFSTS
jgi:competence protein CoiA